MCSVISWWGQPHTQGHFLIHCNYPNFGWLKSSHKLWLAGSWITGQKYHRYFIPHHKAGWSPASLYSSHSSQILPVWGGTSPTSAARSQTPHFQTLCLKANTDEEHLKSGPPWISMSHLPSENISKNCAPQPTDIIMVRLLPPSLPPSQQLSP